MKKKYYPKNNLVKQHLKTQKTVYAFSTAWKRILVRILDLVFLNCIASFFLLLALIKQAKTTLKTDWMFFLSNQSIDYWRFGLFWLLVGIFHFSYFILLVWKTNGYTLFGYLFDLKIINQTDSSNNLSPGLVPLIKKEWVSLFVIILCNFLFVVIAWIFLPNDDYLKLTNTIFQPNNQDPTSRILILTVFRLLFGFWFFLQLIYFIATIYFSKRTNWQDHISKLAVIDLKTKSVNQKSHQKLKDLQHQKIIQQLPGSGIIE